MVATCKLQASLGHPRTACLLKKKKRREERREKGEREREGQKERKTHIPAPSEDTRTGPSLPRNDRWPRTEGHWL
jgi:hypothetical protein